MNKGKFTLTNAKGQVVAIGTATSIKFDGLQALNAAAASLRATVRASQPDNPEEQSFSE